MTQNNVDTSIFAGFEIANATPVPDMLFDELLTELSGSELKVVLYIIRRTCGFKKDADAISYNQFINGIVTKDGRVLDKGCGIKNRTVLSKALLDTERKGYITSKKGVDPHGDKATTLYGLRVKESQGVVTKPYHLAIGGSNQTVPPVVTKPYYGSIETVLGVVSKPYLQDTVIQDTEKQETVIQEDTLGDGSLNANVTPPLVSAGTETDTHSHDDTSNLPALFESLATAGGHIATDDVPTTEEQDAREQAETLRALVEAGVVQVTSPVSEPAVESVKLTEDAPSMSGECPVSDPPAVEEMPREAGRRRNTSKRPEKQEALPGVVSGPPVMPADDAKWCAETVVQIIEAKLGKRYREATRKKELGFAARMFREDPDLTREQFISAYDERNDAWWHEQNGLLHVHHMVEKDRVHSMLDRIDARLMKQAKRVTPTSSTATGQTARSAILLSDERQKRNRERMFQQAAEADRLEAEELAAKHVKAAL